MRQRRKEKVTDALYGDVWPGRVWNQEPGAAPPGAGSGRGSFYLLVWISAPSVANICPRRQVRTGPLLDQNAEGQPEQTPRGGPPDSSS